MSTVKSTSNITAKVIGVVFAAVLWFVVTTNDTFTYEIELPIQYTGPSEDYMITGGKPDYLMATMEGSGKSLVAFSASRLFHTGQQYALVNLNDLSRGNHQIVIEPGDINLAHDSDIHVTGISYPEDAGFTEDTGFPVFIDRVITRNLPVRTDSLGQYTLDKGIVALGKPVPDPAEVSVTGAQETLARLQYVLTKSIEGRRITRADSVMAVDLVTPEYTSPQPPAVNLLFTLDTLSDRRMRVPVRLRNFPRNSGLRPVPDSLNIEVQGAESVVSGLDPATLRIEITYDSYQQQIADGDSLITPSAVLPDGVQDIQFRPRNVRLTKGS